MEGTERPPSLPPAVDAPIVRLDGSVGGLAYYHLEASDGPPVLLLHSINAAASAYEMRPVFEALRGRRPLYMPDLPGFGLSERTRRCYDVRLYVDAIHAMVAEVEEREGAQPVQAIALSLACEFLARAAVERPERFERLGLINPTGFSRGSSRLRHAGSNREFPGFSFLFEGRPWSRPLFDLLTREASVRYFLRRTYGSKDVDEDLVAYDTATARVEGAHHAPFAFLSGRLFSRDIRTIYEALTLQIWVPHGTRGDFRDFSESEWAEAKGNWRFESFDTGALPHFEVPERFRQSLERFLELS